MASASVTLHELPVQMVRIPKVECRPRKCTLILACCDAASIIAAWCIGYGTKLLSGGNLQLATYLHLWPSLIVFFAVFAALRLYPGIICNGVTELERLTAGISVSFIMLAASTFIDHVSSDYSRAVFFIAWASAIFLVPLFRALARAALSARPWWGVPVVMFYTGEESTRVLQMLSAKHEIGIKVVAILASPDTPPGKHSVPVLDYRHASVLRSAGVSRALIALPENSPALLLRKLEAFESMFPKLMLVNDAFSHYSLSTAAQDLGGALSMEVRRNLLDPLPRMIKRAIDLALLTMIAPVVLPLTFLLGALACVGSRGSMFYRHRRIGRGNSTIHVWKIRTMHQDSDAILQKALASDPMLHAEWLSSRKLLRDPRVTPVGKILRRTSLDELPQLWNVLRGEMSLVGPRPIVDEEVDLYGDRFDLYCRVTPGLTGLWQVSGRSRMSVDERVRLDSYYVKNWSPWLDLHILARTTKVVITGEGAY
jgi:Undecaprenyl-phosphate galactose phosphotransferase WbaP